MVVISPTHTHTHTHMFTNIQSLTSVWLVLSWGWTESVMLWWMATELQGRLWGLQGVCVFVHESNQEHQIWLMAQLSLSFFFHCILLFFVRVYAVAQMFVGVSVCALFCECVCVCVFVETEKRVEIREEWVLCVHCSVTKWEWNGTAGLKKREDWISAKHGPLGQRVKERQRDGGRERDDDEGSEGESEKKRL